MAITPFQKKIPETLDMLHSSLELYLKKIFRGENGECIINLTPINTDKTLLNKVQKLKRFRWVESGKAGGVDFYGCLKILKKSWREIAKDNGLDERDSKPIMKYIVATQKIRNRVSAHVLSQYEIPERELFRYFDTFYRFGVSIEMIPKSLEKIDAIRKDLGKRVFPLKFLS